MSVHNGNAVGRLYLLLQFLQGRGDSVANQMVVAQYLQIDPQPTPRLYEGLAAILALPGEARAAFGRAEIKSLPFDRTVAHIDQAETAVVALMTLQNSCLDVKQRFDLGTMVGLEYASFAIGTLADSSPIPTEDLDAVRSAANELIDALRADETLPPAVKRVLFDHAEAVLHALNLLDISGTEAVVKERDRLTGHLQRQPNAFIDAFRNSKVGVALIALNIALATVGNASTQGLAVEKGVERVYELLRQDTTVVPPAAPKQLESGKGESVNTDDVAREPD